MKNFYDAAQYIANKTKTTRMIKFYADIFLGNGHRGLAKIAKEDKIDVLNLAPGEFVVFANRSRTGIKIFAPGFTVSYTKSPNSHPLDLRIIPLIPKFFSGREFRYDDALREVITKKLKISRAA